MSLKNWKLMALAMLTLGLLTLWVPAKAVAQSQTLTFVSWGDSKDSATGTPNTAVLSPLSNFVATGIKPTFTMFAGDLCEGFDNNCASDSQTGWKWAIDGGSIPGNGLFDKTFPFRGNHDDDATLWDTYFSTPTRESVATSAVVGGSNFNCYTTDGTACARTYSFDYFSGDRNVKAHFVGIDMPNGGISNMTSGQIAWLDSDLTAAEGRGVTHSFIMDHGPFYYVDSHRSKPSSALIAVMNKHSSISATLHGHEHVMAYVHVDSAHIRGVTHAWEEFVTGAAGADLYNCNFNRLMSNTGTAQNPDFCEGAPNNRGVSSSDTSPGNSFGFMAITVDGNTFTVREYVQVGQNFYNPHTWTFTKPSS